MKENRKTIALFLSLVLALSSVLWQIPGKFMVNDSATESLVPSEAAAATGPSSAATGSATATDSPAPTATPEATENPYGISSPVKDDNGVTTWDCIYFGNYWQNDTDGNGTADKKDAKEPVRWRVLSIDGENAFLLADKGLDCQPYNAEHANVIWEDCSLRTWLNSTFYQDAFSQEEQSAIYTTTVVNNERTPYYKAFGRKDTPDKVYLMSVTEVSNETYGFDSDFAVENKARCTKGTSYAKAQGALTSAEIGSDDYTGNVRCMLRSSVYDEDGKIIHTVALVGGRGSGLANGCAVHDTYGAVRPVLHINLSSGTWSKAGQVTSDGKSTEPPRPPVSTPTPVPTPAGGSQSEDQNTSPKTDPTDKPTATNTLPTVNTKLKDSSGVAYTVTKSGLSKGEVAYSAPKNKKITSVTIPATVKIENVTYKVTSIKANSFKNCKKLKKATIGKNIKSIGKNAFYGCSKLKNITIKTTKLTNKNVGSKAFTKIYKKAQFKVPKKKLSAYKKLLKKKGVTGKKQTIKK